MPGRGLAVAILSGALLAAGCGGGGDGEEVATEPTPKLDPVFLTQSELAPLVETAPVPNKGDAADDAAIWINPTDRAKSTIIGTDKKGGLAVYDLEGNQIQYLDDGGMNNVDLRDGFPLAGDEVTLVAASDRNRERIALYRVDPATRLLEPAAARDIDLDISAYGLCMYESPTSGTLYVFVNSEKGEVEQWELFEAGGKVDAKKVRGFEVGSQTEGCVADDELGDLYIGEEAEGIWKYGAEPTDDTTRAQVDSTDGGHVEEDVEGLTLLYGPNGGGYLIASSQGSDSYVVYERGGTNAYVTTFRVGEGTNGIDEAEETDGIDVTTANLGPAFPAGLFVVQDGENGDENTNFKLVPLAKPAPM